LLELIRDYNTDATKPAVRLQHARYTLRTYIHTDTHTDRQTDRHTLSLSLNDTVKSAVFRLHLSKQYFYFVVVKVNYFND